MGVSSGAGVSGGRVSKDQGSNVSGRSESQRHYLTLILFGDDD